MADKTQDVFSDIQSFATLRGFTSDKTKKSIKWYQDQVSQFQNIKRFDILASNKKNQRATIKPGTMAFYFYSPKMKKELPYYDTFPLIIYVEPADGGWYGLNMHYLPPALRAKLYTKLLKYNSENKFDLSYQLLKSLGNIWKPAFKRYLKKQVKSNFVIVPEESMTASIFLPVASWKGATQSQIWKDSRKQLVKT
jgi:hypothetical protein